MHIRAYNDWQDRAERRAAMWADKKFTDAAGSLYPLIQSQSNKLLTPTSFSPLR